MRYAYASSGSAATRTKQTLQISFTFSLNGTNAAAVVAVCLNQHDKHIRQPYEMIVLSEIGCVPHSLELRIHHERQKCIAEYGAPQSVALA